MSIRLKAQSSRDNTTGEQTNPVTVETTVDGQTFAWGPGEERVFADDGVAVAHATFDNSAGNYVQEDNTAQTNASPAETAPSRS